MLSRFWNRTFVSTCNQAEPWGNCLMRQLNKGNEGAESIDCTRIHEESVFFPEKSPCPPPMPDKIPQDAPELFYAARSIWRMFFHPSAFVPLSNRSSLSGSTMSGGMRVLIVRTHDAFTRSQQLPPESLQSIPRPKARYLVFGIDGFFD